MCACVCVCVCPFRFHSSSSSECDSSSQPDPPVGWKDLKAIDVKNPKCCVLFALDANARVDCLHEVRKQPLVHGLGERVTRNTRLVGILFHHITTTSRQHMWCVCVCACVHVRVYVCMCVMKQGRRGGGGFSLSIASARLCALVCSAYYSPVAIHRLRPALQPRVSSGLLQAHPCLCLPCKHTHICTGMDVCSNADGACACVFVYVCVRVW